MKGSTAKQLARNVAHWNTWGQHLAIAAAYAACYEVIRHVSVSHWTLTAGLRLACLLLLPLRYWPALALGETLPLVESALLCAPQFGGAWAFSASVPMIVLFMGCVKPLRQRWSLYDGEGRLRMELLLAATLGCALITAVSTSLTLVAALLAAPDAWPEISVVQYFWAYVLGAYLGALTLTPTLLALAERARLVGQVTWTSVWRSALFRDALLWLLPALAGLTCLAVATSSDGIRQLARLMLLLPTIGLAWRHGWHGTAIGGMGASIALAITGNALFDPAMIQSQVILALGISGLLVMGTRVSPSEARTIAEAERS